jgi:hypothetical protein
MIYVINIPLNFYYDGEDMVIDYQFNLTENFQDISEYLFEEEYGVKYQHSSWYSEEGAKDFISNLKKLWDDNIIDTAYLYTKDLKFILWLTNKYYDEAYNQYIHESYSNSYEESDFEKEYDELFE